MLIMEWVPKGQTVENWTDMVTMQTFYHRGQLKPSDFEDRMVADWKTHCPDTSYQPIRSGVERGYAFSFWLLYCEKVSGTGQSEFTFIKAIQGNDAFYSVQKAFKVPPPKDEIVTWSKFMREVFVCDTRIPDRDCPKTD